MRFLEKLSEKRKLDVLQKLGYSEEFIEKNEMMNLTKEEIRFMKENDIIRALSDALSETRENLTFVYVFRIIRLGLEEYDLEPTVFTFNGMYNKDIETIEAFAEKMANKRRNSVESVAKSTGWSIEKAQSEAERVKQKYGYNYTEYYTNVLFKLTDEEIAARKEAEKKELQRCIDWVKGETGWTDYEVIKHRFYCKFAYGVNPHFYFPTRCWEMDDKTLKKMIRLSDSGKLKRKYNTQKANAILNNKVRFNEVFSDLIGRKFWVNRETSYEEFCQFADGLDEIFCKPVDLSRGVGTMKLKVEGNLKELYDYLMAQPELLVEECVKQHHEMSEFYENAVNTVRLFCLLDHDEFVPFASFVRFAEQGVADNIGAGGLGCGVDVATGIIETKGLDRWHRLQEVHPVSGKKFEGFQIPHWDKVLEIAEQGLRKLDGLNYVGWDIAICEDKVVLIEGNSTPSIATYQNFYGYKHEGRRYLYRKYLKKDPEN